MILQNPGMLNSTFTAPGDICVTAIAAPVNDRPVTLSSTNQESPDTANALPQHHSNAVILPSLTAV